MLFDASGVRCWLAEMQRPMPPVPTISSCVNCLEQRGPRFQTRKEMLGVSQLNAAERESCGCAQEGRKIQADQVLRLARLR